jgi:hypothetical protein
MTLRRGGPSPLARLRVEVKLQQGHRAVVAYPGQGRTYADIGAELGVSATTARRRHWWFFDQVLYPRGDRVPWGPVPVQRGTRECPKRRPFLPTRDGWARGRSPSRRRPCPPPSSSSR